MTDRPNTTASATSPLIGASAVSSDPTQNVRELVVSSNLRSDDLREAEARRIDESISAERRRVDEIAEAERRRVDDALSSLRREAELRENFTAQLNLAETKRIDAIRAVDVAAVAIANERATAQATVLANQVATSAETLRALVATQAAATAQQFATTTTQLSERIALLERSNYEGSGRATVSDPAVAKMAAELELLRAAKSAGDGRAGISNQLMFAIVAAVAGLVTWIAQRAAGG